MELYLTLGIIFLVSLIIILSIIRLKERQAYNRARNEFNTNIELIRKEAFTKGKQKANFEHIQEIEQIKKEYEKKLILERANPDLDGNGIIDNNDMSKMTTAYNKDRSRRNAKAKSKNSE